MLAVFLYVLLAGLAPARGDCKKCDDSGLVACPEEARHACPSDQQARCSLAAACAQCAGTRRVPCPKCKRSPPPEHAASQEGHRAWLAGTKPIDALMGRTLAHAESAHFLLTFDIRGLDVKGGETLHTGMHLYLTRLEQLFQRMTGDLHAGEADFLGPTHLFLWEKQSDQERASLAFTRQSSSTESKLMGKAPVVSIHYDKQWLHDESELHQAVVHQIAHCLLSNVWDGIWPGNIRAGWLDEGLAHAYELALFGGVRHYCFVEADTIHSIQKGSWEAPVRAAVERGTAPGFLGVASKNTTELTLEDNLFAWSYVDFVMHRQADKLGPLARALKARRPLKDALADVLHVSPFEFEEQWRLFVTEAYERKKSR